MSKYVPLLVVAAVLLITAGALVIVSRQAQQPEEKGENAPPAKLRKTIESVSSPQVPKGMTLEGAKIEQRDPEGVLEWTVTARGDLEFDKDTQTITGHGVRFEMTSKAKMPVIVNAPVFRADYAAKTLTFDEGVTGVMSDRSASFKVNHVVYNFTSQKLVGTGGARFTQGQYLATAQQIVVDAKAKRVRMSGGVRFERRG